jgi:hypothetical protein
MAHQVGNLSLALCFVKNYGDKLRRPAGADFSFFAKGHSPIVRNWFSCL